MLTTHMCYNRIKKEANKTKAYPMMQQISGRSMQAGRVVRVGPIKTF